MMPSNLPLRYDGFVEATQGDPGKSFNSLRSWDSREHHMARSQEESVRSNGREDEEIRK